MKQLFEEAYKVTKWCECCKHTYLAEKKETQQPVGMRKLFEGKRPARHISVSAGFQCNFAQFGGVCQVL